MGERKRVIARWAFVVIGAVLWIGSFVLAVYTEQVAWALSACGWQAATLLAAVLAEKARSSPNQELGGEG
jgi:hypothetical protein